MYMLINILIITSQPLNEKKSIKPVVTNILNFVRRQNNNEYDKKTDFL